MRNRSLFVISLILFVSILLFSQESKSYIIRFNPLVLKDMDENFLHLSNSFPLLLKYELQNADFHFYSDEELINIKKYLLDKLKNDSLDMLSGLIKKHDNYIFSENFNKDEFSLLGQEINKQKLFFENLSLEDVPETEKSVPIVFNDNISGNITNNDSNQANLIIEGSMEKLDEYIYLQFWLENRILNTKEVFFESAGSPDNLSDLIQPISNELKSIILGRPWGSLELNLQPDDSNILILDSAGHIVVQDFKYFTPGNYDIEISKPGYETKKMSIILNNKENKKLSVNLNLLNRSIISLQTFPAGADLYSGSTWLGKTPVLFMKPITPALLTIKLDGFNTKKYIYKDNNDRDIKLFLQSNLINFEEITNKKRDNFYNSFSYFLLSLPLSLVSYGLSSDYGYAFNREVAISTNSDEADRLMEVSSTWYNVYLSSLFINVSLFINTIFDLVEYITSSDHL
jgi:hypothetical protein